MASDGVAMRYFKAQSGRDDPVALAERVEWLWHTDAEFHAKVHRAVYAVDADERQRTGRGLSDRDIGFARRVAAFTLVLADESSDHGSEEPDHG